MPSTPARFDIYALIHKGLRAHLLHTLHAVGRCDWQDCADARAVLAELDELLAFCRAHIEHEDAVVHPALERRRPGSAEHSAAEHRRHQQAMDELGALAEQVAHLPALRRGEFVHPLYRRLACFVAENLEHMEQEERDNNRLLWETHSDDELIALEQQIVASIGPDEMQRTLHWMLPALTPQERAAFLVEFRQQAPLELFAATLERLCMQLSPKHQAHLDAALGLTRAVEPARRLYP
ncbi:hemerythrin domain-containing protein [Pseudomonas zhanjiangensis]|uniref:Hemerythrin domain-containing protein n=1 Tax=Pseudomonas zhanjiangensis TaxID=3239015 RepID=A0ABV3YNV7_9PSED